MSTLEYIQLRDDLLKKLIDTKDESILQQIKEIFNKNKGDDFYYDLSDEEKKGIKIGLRQIEKGEVVSYNDIISKHQ